MTRPGGELAQIDDPPAHHAVYGRIGALSMIFARAAR
jgi:hypothetical protein